MPLTSENTNRKYRVGENPSVVQTKVFNYSIPELSKDIVRELARDAEMPYYSQRSKQEMIDFLNQGDNLPLQKIQLKIFRSRQ
jgi:hypothetical protein